MILKRVLMWGLGVCLVSLTAIAQTPMPMMPPAHGAAPGATTAPTSAIFDVLAVHATREGKASIEIPSALRSVSKVLELLPFDTFDIVSQEEGEAPFGSETRIPINAQYSFHIIPNQDPASGEINVISRIAMLENGKTIDALWAQGTAAPGKPLVFRGLPMDVGEMVVLVRLKQEDDGEGSDSSDSSETPPEDEEGEDSESDGDQQESDSESPQNQEEESSEEMKEGDEPKDLKNLEALLQSLEDIDRREQKEARNQRKRIRLNGDWW